VKSLVKMLAILLFVFVVLSLSGCFLTITQNLKDGSTLLVSAYDSLDEDYAELEAAFEACIVDVSEENIKKFKELEKKFHEGFDAVGTAIKAEDEVIQSLKSKKEK